MCYMPRCQKPRMQLHLSDRRFICTMAGGRRTEASMAAVAAVAGFVSHVWSAAASGVYGVELCVLIVRCALCSVQLYAGSAARLYR